jgi:hypothetical protein
LKYVFSLILCLMIRSWEIFNVMSIVPTMTSGINSLRLLSLKFSVYARILRRTITFKLILRPTKTTEGTGVAQSIW